MTEAAAAALYEEGDERMKRVAKTPQGSAHSTHNGGGRFWSEEDQLGRLPDGALSFLD
jgi:hypothetical protein